MNDKNNKLRVKKQKVPLDAGNFPIVGIGASAGGLEAIEGFLSGIPAGVDIAFVIIQHLAPEHKSMMAPLLEKHTALEVVEIKDGTRAAPGFVYLNPPNKYRHRKRGPSPGRTGPPARGQAVDRPFFPLSGPGPE